MTACHGLRRAALVLHPLAAEDRAWLLERLDDAQRTRVERALDELSAMGVPRDSEWFREFFGIVDEDDAAGIEEARPVDELRSASAERVWAVASREPSWAIVEILRCGPWPWSGAIVERLQRNRGVTLSLAEVEAMGRPPHARVSAILSALGTEVAATPAPAESDHRTAGATGWRRRFSRLTLSPWRAACQE